jgi:hypothetical protein
LTSCVWILNDKLKVLFQMVLIHWSQGSQKYISNPCILHDSSQTISGKPCGTQLGFSLGLMASSNRHAWDRICFLAAHVHISKPVSSDYSNAMLLFSWTFKERQ